MFNCNLVASDNVSLSATQNADQFAGRSAVFASVIRSVKNFDRRAQKFFNQLANARSQKPSKPQCGWGKYDGFN